MKRGEGDHMEFIEATGIIKRYGKEPTFVEALKGINVAISRGEWLAIMGQSGSGKSTLLTVLGGLNSPSSGTCRVEGTDIYALSSEQRAKFRRENVGFVFQRFHLLEYLSAIENVMLPLAVTALSTETKRDMALEALKRVGLEGMERRLPGELSGGEQERVAIARAIVNSPAVLLADEPTGNLDSRTGEMIMDLFAELNAQGMTIVMVTHSEMWARRASRIMYLKDGKLWE